MRWMTWRAICGCPYGADFFISVWNLHRNPRLWDNPDKFDPDRFPLDQKMPNETTQNFAYLPFGGGQRKCVGDQFAMMESVVILAHLLQNFDFALDGLAEDVGMSTGATIHTKNGLNMKLTRRVK